MSWRSWNVAESGTPFSDLGLMVYRDGSDGNFSSLKSQHLLPFTLSLQVLHEARPTPNCYWQSKITLQTVTQKSKADCHGQQCLKDHSTNYDSKESRVVKTNRRDIFAKTLVKMTQRLSSEIQSCISVWWSQPMYQKTEQFVRSTNTVCALNPPSHLIRCLPSHNPAVLLWGWW